MNETIFFNSRTKDYGTEITSGSDSTNLCLAVTKMSDCIIVRESWRASCAGVELNCSSYSLVCKLLPSGGAILELRGCTSIGRKLTSDGWVPQLATMRLRSCRTNGNALFKAFYSFVRKCVVDDHYDDEDVFPTFGECVKHSAIVVDVNVLASHAHNAPTWIDEFTGTVIGYLGRLCDDYDLRRALRGMAGRFINTKWQLE